MHKIYNIIIIFINNNYNNNNTIINNNYGRLQDHILLFKIPMSRRKHFFHIYRQFGHPPSKSFVSSGLVQEQDSGGYYNRKSPSYLHLSILLLLLFCFLIIFWWKNSICFYTQHNAPYRAPFSTRVDLCSGL